MTLGISTELNLFTFEIWENHSYHKFSSNHAVMA